MNSRSQRSKHALAMALAALLLPAAGWAAGESSTASSEAKAKLIRPLAINHKSGSTLSFGILIKSSGGSATVVLDPRASLLPTVTSSDPSGVTPLPGSGIDDAVFEVLGEPAEVIQVTLPASSLIKKGAGGTAATEMAISSFNADVYDLLGGINLQNDATKQFTMPADGSAWLEVGGSLAVESDDQYGEYVGTFNVTVSYV